MVPDILSQYTTLTRRSPSQDPRFRQIVKQFGAGGYLDAERDEFVAA